MVVTSLVYVKPNRRCRFWSFPYPKSCVSAAFSRAALTLGTVTVCSSRSQHAGTGDNDRGRSPSHYQVSSGPGPRDRPMIHR